MGSMPIFDWAIRATLLLAVAVLLARLLERRSATAAHRLLATVFACILAVLPLCMNFLPGWQWTVPAWKADATPESRDDANEGVNSTAPGAEIRASTDDGEQPLFTVGDAVRTSQSADGDAAATARAGRALHRQEVGVADTVPVAQGAFLVDSAHDATVRSIIWPQVLMIAWLGIAAALFLRFAAIMNRLWRFVSICKNASPQLIEQVGSLSLQCGVKRHVRVLLSKPDSMPLACWLGRWVIVVPENLESWPDDLKEVTLLHELGHVARRDVWADYLAQLVECVLWPNPLAWVAKADTRRLRERACDEWSLQRYSGDAKRYALSLIAAVARCQQPGDRLACAMADRRGLESRLQWLFSGSASSKWALLSLPAMLMTIGLAVVVATAAPAGESRSDDSQLRASDLMPVVVSREPASGDPAITVTGTVIDEAGKPLAGAAVVLRAKLQPTGYAPGLTHDRDVLAQTTTNADGRFRFAGIAVSPRMVEILDKLRQGQPGVQVLAWSDGFGLEWKPVSSLGDSKVELQLRQQADVSGIVVDEDGNPLESGNLRVTGFTRAADNLDSFLGGPDDLNTVRSEMRFEGEIKEGRFTIANMPGDYRIFVRCTSPLGHSAFLLFDTGNGASSEVKFENADRESKPVHRTPIRATVKQQPWVRVKVVDNQGRPVSGGGLEAVAERDYGYAAVDDDGTAVLTVSKPGVHTVSYAGDPMTPVIGVFQEVDFDETNPGAVEFRLPETRNLSGRVVDGDTGDPVAGVYVYGNRQAAEDEQSGVRGTLVVSGADGRFQIPVTDGVYRFSIRHLVDGYFVPRYYSSRDPGPEPALPTVTITPDNLPGPVVVKIARGLVVNGTVLDQQGVPARGLRVTATNIGGPFRQTSTVTDSDGHFRITGLSPYLPMSIAAWAESGIAEQVIAATLDHPWEVTLTKIVDLQLAAGTTVVGRVTRSGRPVAGIGVRLVRGAHRTEQGVPFLSWGETKTDEQGRYRLAGLRKGDEYQLEVEAQDGAEVRDWRYQMPYINTVDVEDGATIDLPDAVLKSNGQSLAGVVVDPDGNPVEGITVSARLASGENLSRPQDGPPPWTETDKEGRFHLTHLPDEPISLMAYKANPAGGRILYPSHAYPDMSSTAVRIVLDPRLREPLEDLD
jgi:beta-lactamase regulating signal transducer with metallopeptidase domain/protocatechuate 3,4-dioxygenase beta subunit